MSVLTNSTSQPPSATQSEQFHETVSGTYASLRAKAHELMARYPGAVTLQATAVVHEAIVKILQSTAGTGRLVGREMTMVCISRAMRDVLVDNCRKRRSRKRGNGRRAAVLHDDDAWEATEIAAMDLKMALDELRTTHPRQADVVEMWNFGGFKIKEIASALRVSNSTVESDLRKARGNLLAILSGA